ncbi:Protein CBG20912 [Caenorhabditis briggsae]|uniref:Protein CBG20912 n=1 Tax=Caenorhabditis briggsae TaxID=6238 RepID=A8XYX8_CAEBR|nr:Protein CBG20912 [Caenorhabditis briggsae]CAP37845.1 Protein CBG20912 [Caenorhabditis briggsae]
MYKYLMIYISSFEALYSFWMWLLYRWFILIKWHLSFFEHSRIRTLTTIIPLILIYIPIAILFIFPMIAVDIGFASSFIAMTIAVFTAIDPLPNIFIIKNYRKSVFAFFAAICCNGASKVDFQE